MSSSSAATLSAPFDAGPTRGAHAERWSGLVRQLRRAGRQYAQVLTKGGASPDAVRAQVRVLVDVAVAAEGWAEGAAGRALADALEVYALGTCTEPSTDAAAPPGPR